MLLAHKIRYRFLDRRIIFGLTWICFWESWGRCLAVSFLLEYNSSYLPFSFLFLASQLSFLIFSLDCSSSQVCSFVDIGKDFIGIFSPHSFWTISPDWFWVDIGIENIGTGNDNNNGSWSLILLPLNRSSVYFQSRWDQLSQTIYV